MSSPMMDQADIRDQIIYSEDAERSVLGSMMHSENAIADVIEKLRVEDFYRPQHQAVFSAILDLYQRNCPTDALSVGEELTRRGEFVRVGGGPYLHTLMASVHTTANVGHHAQIVADKAVRRRMVEAGHRIVQFGQNASGEEIGTALARAQEELDRAANVRAASSETLLAGSLIAEMYDEIEKFQTGAHEKGISTGITDLDAVLHGLRPGQMITLAARPGVGKSVLGVQFARQCAIEQGKPAVIFSLEMSRMEIMIRMAAAESKVRLDAIHEKGGLSDYDWARLARGMSRVQDAPLLINDEATATVAEVRAKAKQLHKRYDGGLGLIVVDYLQLMGSGKRVESRQQEVSEFSRQLKLLAKELEVPVVAISQLNRGPEQRQDRRPQLADLRESGSIEQDSDVVILIHRPDANGAQDEERAGEADLIVAKNRGGRTTTVTVAHQLHWSRFMDLARE